jgi:hypothetical protein
MNKVVTGFVAAGIAAMLVGCLGVIMLVAALRERAKTPPPTVPAVETPPPLVRPPAADPVKRSRRPVRDEVEEENPRPIRRKVPRDEEEEPAPPKAKPPAKPAAPPG